MEKRGQGLSTTAIILIILGVIILVVLVIGFRAGWLNIKPYVSSSNVDSVVTQCSIACTSTGKYNFCSLGRDLSNGTSTFNGVTCYYLAKEQPQYGIAACPAITCNVAFIPNPGDKIATASDLAKSCSSSNSGMVLQTLYKNKLISTSAACP